MKKVIGILALLALTGNIASAELLKDFKWDGKILVNAYTTNNLADADSDAKDKTSDVDTRVEVNMGFNLTEDVDAVVSAVKCNRQYAGASETAEDVTDQFFFEQAYLNLKGVLGIDHKIGRQYYGDAGDLVIFYGPSNSYFDTTANVGANELGISGLDGWTGWYKNDKLDLHAITAKLADGASQPDVDTDLVGVKARYALMGVLNPGAYIYEQKMTQAAGTADLTKDVIGVKADGKLEAINLSYYGELAKNYGRQGVGKNYTGTAFLAGAKMEMDLIGKWTFMGEMGMGSGDDKTYAADDEDATFSSIATDYRAGIIWGGISGNEGLGNLTTWNLGAKWVTPMSDKLTLSGKLYYLAPTVTKINSTGAGAAKTDIGYDAYGQELDLCANWQHNENVGLKAYYAMFMTDGDYADTVNAGKDDLSTALGLALSVKF